MRFCVVLSLRRKTFAGIIMLSNMLIVSFLFTLLSIHPVSASHHKKIKAFFQGTCGTVEPSVCSQVCHDITGGGFICDCLDGFLLAPNGHDCQMDKNWHAEQLLPQPMELTEGGGRPQAGGDNLSARPGSAISEGGAGKSPDVRLGAGNLPEPVELGASDDDTVVRTHSLDMKGGLDPPQALYQLREGGADSRDLDTVALSNNVWPEDDTDALYPFPGDNDAPYPLPEDNDAPYPLPKDNKNTDNDVRYLPPGDSKGGDVVTPPGLWACEGIDCLNNGTCLTQDGYARCDCPLGYGGSYCQKEMEVRFPRFRGTGYLALPVLQDGYKEFAVALEFRPEALNGLLLFSSEFDDARKDFFAVTLSNGFIEFRFDCGTGSAVLISSQPVKMGQWNRLVLARNENRGSLQLNSGDLVQGTAQGAFTRITLRQNLFIGGYSKMAAITGRINTSKTFVGCVQHLIINGYRYDFRKGGLVGDSEFGVNVGECSEGVCAGVQCQNGGTCHAKTADTHVCLCPLGFHGDLCEKETSVRIPRFNGHSHLEFAGLGRTVLVFTELEAVVKPEGPDGLVLYNGYTHDRKGDFIALSLRDGHVEFSFDLGTGPAVIRSQKRLKLHQWHVIRASRTGLEGVLKVNDDPEVKGQAQGAYTQLTLLQSLFLGGHHNFDHTSRHANLSASFVGCIQKVVVNKRPLSILKEGLGGASVEPCQHPCAGTPCMNSGQCLADGEVYQCLCPVGYTNTNCEDKMERLPTKPMFGGSSYLTYTDKNVIKRVSGNKMDLQLHIKPKGASGLLFWSSQELLWSGMEQTNANFDYVSLGFTDGSLQLRYNLGSGEALIGYNDSRLFDGEWHFIRVQRDNQDAYMEVDWKEIVEGSAPGTYTMLNTNRIVYLGGLPDVAKMTGRRFTSNYEGCVKDMLLATDFKVKLLGHAHSGRNVVQCKVRI